MRIEAIRLHVEEGWTYKRTTEHLGIRDKQRMKKWMMKYKKQGEFGLLDQRGRDVLITSFKAHLPHIFTCSLFSYILGKNQCLYNSQTTIVDHRIKGTSSRRPLNSYHVQ
jgi:hypothetical protein